MSSASQSKPASYPDNQPRVWILQATGSGDNRQLANLAAALGWPCEVKYTVDSLPRVLAGRLRRTNRQRVPARKRDQLQPPWPDVILISGGRCVADAMGIRAESAGRSRVICVGRPWAPLAWFDRVITTPQYRLPDHEKVLQTLLPLNRPDPARGAAAGRAWRPRWSHLPRPWLGVLLGGDSGSYRFTRSAARAMGRQIDEQARAMGGALLISSSARTPQKALDALLAELQAPHFCHRWQDVSQDASQDNPLEAMLALVDGFIVTADSASMLAEAYATGKPVASFVPPLRWRARVLTHNWSPRWPGHSALLALRHRLILKGLWVPARDMSRVHAALQSRGIVRPIRELGAGAQPGQVLPDDLDRVVASIGAMFPEHEAPLTDIGSRAASSGRVARMPAARMK